MKEKKEIVPKQMVYLLFVCSVLLGLSLYMPQPRMAPFVSAEVHFYDPSSQGLKIMPASCASNPSWAHAGLNGLIVESDGIGFKSPANTTEYNRYSTPAAMWICVTNTTGSAVFVPAKTAAELNAFKSNPPAGVTAW